MTSKQQFFAHIGALAIVLALLAWTIFHFNPYGILGGIDEPEDETGVQIPILMYHHFELEEELNYGTMISGEMFESQIKALSEAGYNSISFEQLVGFVSGTALLPVNPFIITIDDGYLSVYEVAFPILKKYGMQATVFIIGISHGKSYYKDTDHEILPRFNDEQALEMVQSGLISIQSHSYDMHQFEAYEDGPFRQGVLQMEGESNKDYIQAFIFDFVQAASQIEDMVGKRPFVYSYPYGLSNDMTDGLLRDLGVKVTLTIEEGVNSVEIGSPGALFRMNRINIPGFMTPEAIVGLMIMEWNQEEQEETE